MTLRSRLATASLVAVLAFAGVACGGDEQEDQGPVDVDSQTDVGDDTGTTGGDDAAST